MDYGGIKGATQLCKDLFIVKKVQPRVACHIPVANISRLPVVLFRICTIVPVVRKPHYVCLIFRDFERGSKGRCGEETYVYVQQFVERKRIWTFMRKK